ncbi:hypothetical protein SSBG_02436 [Streptomyces sp. SPB074]|nr:hypothetical protein SSBG_02436 [Streptomyces sp. SPB074]
MRLPRAAMRGGAAVLGAWLPRDVCGREAWDVACDLVRRRGRDTRGSGCDVAWEPGDVAAERRRVARSVVTRVTLSSSTESRNARAGSRSLLQGVRRARPMRQEAVR